MEVDWQLAAEYKAGEPEREKNGHFRFITKDETARMLQLAADGAFRKAKKLVIANTSKSDLSWISECKNLEELDVSASSSTLVDLSDLRKLCKVEFSASFQKSAHGLGQNNPVDRVTLRSPTPESLAVLGSGVKSLLVSGAPTEWPTLDRSDNLLRLKIVFCKKGPLDLSKLSSLRFLRTLSLDNLSNGIFGCARLSDLRNLEELFFWDVRPIDSLDWIYKLPRLKTFAAWGRNDVDTNLIKYLDQKGMGDGISQWTRNGAM